MSRRLAGGSVDHAFSVDISGETWNVSRVDYEPAVGLTDMRAFPDSGYPTWQRGVAGECPMMEQIVDQRGGVDRRVKRISFRFPDRRLGFSRRQDHVRSVRGAYDRMLGAYRYNSQSLALVLIAVTLLNIADLVVTLRVIELGAVELNPIMAALIESDPLLASLFKVTIGLVVVTAMWAMRRYRRVLEASLLLLGGFTVLIAYSLSMLLASV